MQSSTIERKYRKPSKVDLAIVPQMSQWISWKGNSVLLALVGKWNLLCLARRQIKHEWKSATDMSAM